MTAPNSSPKSLKARTRGASKKNNILGNKIRIFAILWCILMTATLVCLLFLFRNVMTYNASEDHATGGLLHHINNANHVDSMRNYVQDLISKNKNNLRSKAGHAVNLAAGGHAPITMDHDKKDNNIHDGGSDGAPSIVRPEDAVTVAFAVSVTGCGADPLTEGAAVLKHSIHRASVRGTLGGRYNYKMYAIYHPKAKTCAKTLEALGYELLERNTFVKVADIEGDFLRTNIEKNGCCGEKELIKLEAYTLIQHPIVVHLDLDVLVLKPLDNLFDVMLQNEKNAVAEPMDLDLTHIDIQWPPKEPMKQVNALFTRDCKLLY